jgi:SAM-dependent methyltransferase
MATAEEMSQRLFEQSVNTMETAAIWLGHRMGWYDALYRDGPMSAQALAAVTSTHPRYAREWCEQQAVTGILEIDEAGGFRLPSAHAEVILDPDSLNWLEPFVRMVVGALAQLPRLEQVYREGGGVPWVEYGADVSQAQADMNRPVLLHAFATAWVPQMLQLQARLTAGARVADIGCGHGWLAIGLARAFPTVHVDGYDPDPVAIEAAARNAAEHGVADRVAFHLGEVTDPLPEGPFDVAIAMECIHDIADPVKVLSAVRQSCREDALVLVIDEAADPVLTAPGDETQRLLYGFSLLVCLPDSMSYPGSVATGTVMRPSTLDGYARAAGFAGAQELHVADTAFFRVYTLRMPHEGVREHTAAAMVEQH